MSDDKFCKICGKKIDKPTDPGTIVMFNNRKTCGSKKCSNEWYMLKLAEQREKWHAKKEQS